MESEQQQQLVEGWLDPKKEANLPLHLLDEDALTHMLSVGTYIGTDQSSPGASGSSIYSDPKNLGYALGSILNRVMLLAKFFPLSLENSVLSKAFVAYLAALDECPLLTILDIHTNQYKNQNSNYDGVIKKFVDLIDGLSNTDKISLENKIVGLTDNTTIIKPIDEMKEMIAVSIVDITDPSNPEFGVYYTKFEIEKRNGLSVVGNLFFEVTKITYRVNQKRIQAMANKLQRLDPKSLNEWVFEITSPASI